MATYSIKELEQISGIKAHTIRMWEQRYGIFKPKRTETNIRFYDEYDLKLLLNIAMLVTKGIRISKIAGMSEQEIGQHVRNAVESCDEYLNQINALVLATIELDEAKFEKVFSACTLRFGFEKTVVNVIYPLFTRIGIFWQTGTVNPSQEHFLTNLVRQKIISAIDGLHAVPTVDGRKFMLFLPEGELHEIPLLFATWVLRSRGQKVIYLGQSVPFEDLVSIVEVHMPQYLLTIITTNVGKESPDDYLKKVVKILPQGVQVLVSGQAVLQCAVEFHHTVKKLTSVSDLDKLLAGFSRN